MKFIVIIYENSSNERDLLREYNVDRYVNTISVYTELHKKKK